MLFLALSVAWLALVATLLVRAVRQYAAYEQLAPASAGPGEPWPPLVVILPVRNERRNVEPCLTRLLAQDYPPGRMEIVVVDDGSTDGTKEIVCAIAAAQPRVRLVVGGALPDGWKGKPFACWQGARAVDDDGDADARDAWLCFIDCDTRPEPGLLTAAVARAEQRGLDLLSLEPFQELGTFWERVLIPAGFFLLAFSQDLRRVNDPALPDAFANGQFILVRRRAYEAVGGHAATRACIAEDSALARLVKSAGLRIGVLGAEALLSTRMYIGLRELWEGVSKNLIEMIGGRGRALLFAAAGALLAAASVALPLAGWWRVAHATTAATATEPPRTLALVAALCATAASASLLGAHVGGARYLRIPLAYGLLFPLGYLVGAGLAVYSVWIRARRRIVWKGRVYARPDAEA